MSSRKCPRLFFICLGPCLAMLFATLPVLPIASAHASTFSPLRMKALVITMFTIEAQPWLSDQELLLKQKFTVPGADPTHNQLYCSINPAYKGVCLAIIGVDKVNAADSMMAILRDPQFSFIGCYFLTAGTSSTSPYRGTLGSTAWANWVVDWDQGYHLFPETAPGLPYGYKAPTTSFEDSTSVFHLDPALVQKAYELTVPLTPELHDSQPADKERSLYPGQAGQKPSVTRCDTAAGDNLWAGYQMSQEAQYITSSLTGGAGYNCTYEQEDTAVAGSLSRFPMISGFNTSTKLLHCYLDLRSPSAFDQPYPGQSVQDFVLAPNPFRANDIATYNLHLVGSTMVKALISSTPCKP